MLPCTSPDVAKTKTFATSAVLSKHLLVKCSLLYDRYLFVSTSSAVDTLSLQASSFTNYHKLPRTHVRHRLFSGLAAVLKDTPGTSNAGVCSIVPP